MAGEVPDRRSDQPTPASASGRTGHHSGSAWKPRALGQVGEDPSLHLAEPGPRKKYAAAKMGTPMIAASTRSAS